MVFVLLLGWLSSHQYPLKQLNLRRSLLRLGFILLLPPEVVTDGALIVVLVGLSSFSVAANSFLPEWSPLYDDLQVVVVVSVPLLEYVSPCCCLALAARLALV